jgi:CDP-glucose 4,6-dehydratase
VAIARCGNIYGGGDLNWNRIVPQTIQALLRGESPIIRSDGTYVRDYIYVKDVTRAYMHLAEGLNEAGVPGEAFNFSTESPLTVLALVRVIQRLMAFEQVEPQILNQAEGEIRNQSLSTDKVRALLAWQPQFNLEQGLTETIEWYRVFLAN